MSIILTTYFSYVMAYSNTDYSVVFSVSGAIFSAMLVYYLFTIIKKFQVI